MITITVMSECLMKYVDPDMTMVGTKSVAPAHEMPVAKPRIIAAGISVYHDGTKLATA